MTSAFLEFDRSTDVPLARPLGMRAVVLCLSDELSTWHSELLRSVAAVKGSLIWLVRVEGPPRARERGAARALARGPTATYPPPEPDPTQILTTPIEDKRVTGEQLADTVAALSPHVVLDLTKSTLTEKLIAVPSYGVWHMTLAHSSGSEVSSVSDLVRHRGIAIVRMVAARADASPVVLREAALPVIPYSCVKTLRVLQEATAHWPGECLAWIQDYGSLPKELSRASPREAEPRRRARPAERPTVCDRLQAKGRRAIEQLRRQAEYILWSDVWSVGLADANIAAFVEGARGQITWLPTPKGTSTYYADPFGVITGESITILAEHFDYSAGRGTVQSVELKPGQASRWSPDLRLASGVHLSYPYLLRDGTAIYCVPETHQAREIALYRSTDFPLTWEKDLILVPDFAGVDPTIVQIEDRWWLFATDRDQGADAVLHAWWADGLRGPWHAHARNPVKVDIRSSRPAGTPYIASRRLLRPTQDNSQSYGRRIVVNMVTALSPTRFTEEPAAVVTPAASWPFRHGVHTIAAVGDRTVFDAKRRTFVAVASREKTMILARRLVRQCSGSIEAPPWRSCG